LPQYLPHGLQLDVGLLQPLLVTNRLLAQSSSNAAGPSSATANAVSSATEEQIIGCAEAARCSNNLGLAARLLQRQSNDTAEAGQPRHVPLRLRIAEAAVAWTESPHAVGRLAAAEQLAASLKAATVEPADGIPVSKLRARGWLLLHSWLSGLGLPPLLANELLGVFSASLATSADAVQSQELVKQLAPLDNMQLTPVHRASAACLRAAVSSDEHSSEAWRALGVWLSGFLQTHSPSAPDAGDAPSNDVADPASKAARGMAFAAYCRSLRAAGLSQVWLDAICSVRCGACIPTCFTLDVLLTQSLPWTKLAFR